MITICYVTSRLMPQLRWFFESLDAELQGNYDGVKIVVVDFWSQALKEEDRWTQEDVDRRRREEFGWLSPKVAAVLTVTPPMGNVYQGPHRLPKQNWFAKPVFLNTGVCFAPDGYFVGIDDLSVIRPGWWRAVEDAEAGGYIACGAYEKVKNLIYKNGVATFEDHPPGHDHRSAYAKELTPCTGQWMYGCSFACPVQAILDINGWPLDTCMMGYEDTAAGLAMQAAGYRLMYDPRMLTLESDELHSQPPVMRREDPGQSPNDMSHAMVNMYQGIKRFPQYYGEEGLAGIRQRVLAGSPLPVIGIPEHLWFNGKPLRDM